MPSIFDDLIPNNATESGGVSVSGAFDDLIPEDVQPVETSNTLSNVSNWIQGDRDFRMSREEEEGQARLWAGLPEKDPTKELGVFGNTGRLVVEGLDQAKANYAALLATGQWDNLDEESKSQLVNVIANAARPYDRPEELNSYYEVIGEEAVQVGDAWKKGNYGTAALEAIDFLGETLLEGVTNPEGFLYATSEQAANLIGTWAPGIAGAKAGAGTGALIGGGPGAAIGGTTGFFAGTALGSYLIETGAQIREFIRERGGNPEDPAQIAAALNDPTVREDMLDRASTKGLSIAAWDATANLLGIKLLKNAQGPLSTATRGTAAMGAQVTGAAGGEIQGQYLATGKVDPEEVGLEVALEMGPGGFGDIATSTWAARQGQRAPTDAPIHDPGTSTPEDVIAQESNLAQELDQTDAGDALDAALAGVAPEIAPEAAAAVDPITLSDDWFTNLDPEQRIAAIREELKTVDTAPEYNDIGIDRKEIKASLNRALKNAKEEQAAILADPARVKAREDARAAFTADEMPAIAPVDTGELSNELQAQRAAEALNDLADETPAIDDATVTEPLSAQTAPLVNVPSFAELDAMGLKELQAVAKDNGLPVLGRKSVLKERLVRAFYGTSAEMPTEYVDSRLAYGNYRDSLRGFVEQNWVPGGGISVIPAQGAQRTSETGDLNYDFGGDTIRTKSVNPQWVQNLGEDISRKDLLNLVDRAAAGDTGLTERQVAIVSSVLDEMDGGVAGMFIPQQAAALEDLESRDAGIPPIEAAELVDALDEYESADFDPELEVTTALTLDELRQRAVAEGLESQVEGLFERNDSDAVVAGKLFELLESGRNEQADDRANPGRYGRPSESLQTGEFGGQPDEAAQSRGLGLDQGNDRAGPGEVSANPDLFASRQEEASGSAENDPLALSLNSYTQADLDRQVAAQNAQAEADLAQSQRDAADAERDQFSLTGSNLPADANPAQVDLVDAARAAKPRLASKADGTPVVMYHGTNATFDQFNMSEQDGAYFSSDKDYAAGYADVKADFGGEATVREAYLLLQNPLELSGENDTDWKRFTQRELDKRELQKQGYDGVVLRYANGDVEAMVFDPSQVEFIDRGGSAPAAAQDLAARHAVLDPKIDALSDADAVKAGEVLGIKYKRGEDIREKIKAEHPDDQERALSAVAPAAPSARSAAPITDFGEKIGGARKDVWSGFKDSFTRAGDLDVESQPLSKSFPVPNYQGLLDAGTDPYIVASIRAIRDSIPAKPRKGYKLRRWVESVQMARNLTTQLMELPPERARTVLATSGEIDALAELYQRVGHDVSLANIRVSSAQYSVHNGVRYSPAKTIWTVENKRGGASMFSNMPSILAEGDTREEAIQKFIDRFEQFKKNPVAKKPLEFSVYKRGDRNKEIWIGRKSGKALVWVKGPFDEAKLAFQYIKDNQAQLEQDYKNLREVPFERNKENQPRVGADLRGGLDVTPDQFAETFGFRGVEFGNWVENKKRQESLNEAYDALLDMASLLDIPPKAISLNGELAIAFGARGIGGKNAAAAHYEPGKVVINLTKKSGAGSLGHEWWHALDNYFSRMRERADGYMTGDARDVMSASLGNPVGDTGAVRPEMVQAFGDVLKAVNETDMPARSKTLDKFRSAPYWSTKVEMTARAFEAYLIQRLREKGYRNDYLANIVDNHAWIDAALLSMDDISDAYPYPIDSEVQSIVDGFDRFFDVIESKETDRGVALYETQQGYNQDNERASNTVSVQEGNEKVSPEQGAFDFDPAADVRHAREEARDQFNLTFRRVPTQTLKIGVDRVTTPEEAAHVLSYLRRLGQEQMAALVLDKDGNILDVQRHTIGGKDEATVYPSVLAPAVASVEGAAQVYLAHNHPSGDPTASRADYNITAVVKRWLDGTGVELKGHVVLGLGNSSTWFFTEDTNSGEMIQIMPRLRRRDVSVTERKVSRLPKKELDKITNPRSAYAVIESLESDNALVLLDNRNQVVGVLSMTPDEMARLRDNDQVNRIYQAVDRTNANGAILKYQVADIAAAKNLVNFLNNNASNSAGLVRMLDAFEVSASGTIISGAEALDSTAKETLESRGTWFSRTEPGVVTDRGAPTAIGVELVISVAEKIASRKFGRRVNVADGRGPVRVVRTESALPAEILKQANEDSARGEILAVMHDGKMYIVANRMTSEAQVEETMLHEGAHLGQRSLFGDQIKREHQRLWSQLGGEQGVRQWAEQLGIADRMEPYYETARKLGAQGKMDGQQRRGYLIDEFIALAQGEKAYRTLPEKVRDSIRAFIGWVRNAMRKLGFSNLTKFNDKDLAHVLRSVDRAWVKDASRDAKRPRFMVAWHGTPHEVDAFSTDNVGTGEGNQTFGWGLYFASRREIGAWYQKKLAKRAASYTLNGEDVGALHKQAIRQEQYQRASVLEEILQGRTPEEIQEYVSDYNGFNQAAIDFANSITRENLKGFDRSGKEINAYGTLYQVDLAPSENEYLLLDEPLSAQSEQVRAALSELALEGDPLGSDIYALLEDQEGSAKAASEYLKTLGIRGNKYLDGVSRNRTYRQIRDEFLNVLPEDADMAEVMEMVEAGEFSAGKERILRALDADDWLGFDYPAQAITAALADNISRYDASRELIDAIREERTGGTYNYVIFDGADVEITARFARKPKTTKNQNSRNTTTVFIGRDADGKDITVQSDHPSLKDKSKLASGFKRLFFKEGLLGDEAFQRSIESMGMKNRDEINIEFYVADFLDNVKKTLGKPYEKLSDAEKLMLNAALQGDPVKLAPGLRASIDLMRTSVDMLSSRLQQATLDEVRYRLEDLSPKRKNEALAVIAKAVRGEEVAEEEWAAIDPIVGAKIRSYLTIEGNKGHYLNRSYQVFDDPTWPDKVAKDSATMDAARRYIEVSLDPDGEMDSVERADRVEGLINKILRVGVETGSMTAFMNSQQLGQKDLSIIRKRKDIAPEIRALMGEYKDARVNFVRTMSKLSWLVANHHFLKSIREDNLGVFLSKKESGRMSVQITASDRNTMAPLAGLYATPEFAQALKDAVEQDPLSGWFRFYLKINSSVKYGKTVLSPTTSARNFYSAFMFAFANGHFNYGYALKAAANTWSDLGIGKKNQNRRAYLAKLAEMGVLHDNPYAGELRALLDEVADMDTLKGSKPVRMTKEILNFATKVYRAGDDFHKIVGFENEKKSLMRSGIPEARAEELAAERIRNGYPTYSMVPKAIRWLRRFPLVGTFVSFPWEMMRTSWHLFGIMKEDIAMGRTAAATRRAAGLALAASAAQALSALTMAMFGIGDDDDEAIRKIAPEWQRNAQLMYLGFDDKGMPVYLDLSHLDPYTYLKGPVTALLNGNNKTAEDKLSDSIKTLLDPFLAPEITFQAITEVWNNQNEFGRKIYNEYDDTFTQTMKQVGYLFGVYPVTDKTGKLMPGFLTNLERTMKAALGEKSAAGRVFDLSDEALSWVGFRFTTLDMTTALKFRAMEFKDAKAEAGRPIRSVLTNPNIGGADRMANAYEQSRLLWEGNWREMIATVRAAKALRLSEQEIAESLLSANMSKADVARLLKGEIPKYVPSSTSLKNMRKQLIQGSENRSEMMREWIARMRALQVEVKNQK
jgi:hypothetical protein